MNIMEKSGKDAIRQKIKDFFETGSCTSSSCLFFSALLEQSASIQVALRSTKVCNSLRPAETLWQLKSFMLNFISYSLSTS